MSPTVHLEVGKDYACTLLPGQWNGWEQPVFSRSVAEQIMADAMSEGWALSAKLSDGVCVFVMAGSDEREEFPPDPEGNYRIGTGSWCWILGKGQTDFAVNDALVASVAKEFARLIREYIPGERLAHVVLLNRTGHPSECATHTYLDANEVMAEAFQRCGICPPAVVEDAPEDLKDRQNAVWNAAWTMAKRADFSL